MGLQLGAGLEAGVVVIAEALADQERQNQHGTYDLKLNMPFLALYTRKDRDIECRKKAGGEWVSIGGNVGADYLPPHWDQHRVRATLQGMMREMDTIIGDFNCFSGTKKRVLQELIETEDWMT